MAVGLTLIFGVMRVVNFAHGDMMVWGMYLAFVFATRLGVVMNPLGSAIASLPQLETSELTHERLPSSCW